MNYASGFSSPSSTQSVFMRLSSNHLQSVRWLIAAIAGGYALISAANFVDAAERVNYLLPAPLSAPAFAPFVIAQQQALYEKAGLEVTFSQRKGGFAVGEALANGEGDLGGASGDTPILLVNKGLPVKGVALLGGKSFLTLISRQESQVDYSSLAGKRLGVPSFKDVSYYALNDMTKRNPGSLPVIVEMSPPQLWAALAADKLDGFVGTIDWGVQAEKLGAHLNLISLDHFYPAMAQSILASNQEIARHPERIKAFVQATLVAIDEIRRHPEQAAAIYRQGMPDTPYSHAELTRIFQLFSEHVYASQSVAGTFDPTRMQQMQAAYQKLGLVNAQVPLTDLYSNKFVE
ncbi:ABC transporter substrate-binding protein [Pseudomonas graminis]|uniref:ABC transporter substrate-binding protein n=1 Tax=Pseudomonas graminis TaxID=158627 RepID=UPI003C1613AC